MISNSCYKTYFLGRRILNVKWHLFLGTLLLAVAPSIFGQTGAGANFGIEADTYSGDITSGLNTDDWFYNGSTGSGVIDEVTAASMNYGVQ